MRKNILPYFTAIFITIVYFTIHLTIINDYGLSWDFHNHYYAGLFHLGLPVPSITEKSPVPFTPPDPRLSVNDPFGPFTQIIPTLSYLLLYKAWHILPFDSAYNFPMIVFGSLGVWLLFVFLYESLGFLTALFGSFFLMLTPNYFGYLHNNMKDIPNAFAFTLSVYFFWKLVKQPKAKNLILAVTSFAVAFNIKINSILIPFVCLLWYILKNAGFASKKITKGNKSIAWWKSHVLVVLYFIFSPLAAIVLWWPFWKDPLGKLLEFPYFYSHNTLNMPVLLFGKIYRSGVNIPWYYPFIYIFINTPVPILFLFVVGLIVCIKKSARNSDYLLYIIWFFIPVSRYLIPKSGAIDGMRHFLEVVYPLCVIAGIGGFFLYKRITKSHNGKIFASLIGFLVFVILARNIIYYHPFQTSYFNVIAGGIKGASGRFDIDYWGTPQKNAMLWLNRNAPSGSTVFIAMAQSSAGMYLRADLLENLNTKDMAGSDYAVILNRESFFNYQKIDKYLRESIKKRKIVYTKKIDDVPLVWVFKNE